MHKNKIVLWGTGKYGEIAYSSLIKSECEVVKVIDSSQEKIGKIWNGKLIEKPDCLLSTEFDWLLLAVKESSVIMNMDFVKAIEGRTIIFAEADLSKYKWINELPLKKEKQDNIYAVKNNRLVNKKYENSKCGLIIKDSLSCLERIKSEKVSMVRYGDGEFEIMSNHARPWFQEPNKELAERLQEIIKIDEKDLIVAIPDQFDSLEKYTEEAADSIRSYMIKARSNIMKVLDKKRIYYDAYVSRPYLIYKDKKESNKIFGLWKEVWKERDVIIVEGRNTRNGVGNDLLLGTRSVKRIVCPIQNAFDIYNDILREICVNVQKEKLILISLGPTATVLAYDLYRRGYQAIDIGQIDNEYEWFLAKSDKRIHIKGKAVPEIGEQSIIDEEMSEEYKEEIIINLS